MRVLVTDSAAWTSTAPERRRRGARSTGVVSPYDFRRPITLSREKGRLLSIAFETFARQASTVMTSALRSVCEVELVSVDQVAYSEYVETLGDMTYMTVFSMEPVTQPAVLQTPLAVTMTCIDNLLGGPGGAAQPERPLTDLEGAVVGRLYERLVAEVRYAFSSLVALDPRVTTVEYSPQLAQVAAASDVVVVARHTLRMGDAEFPLSVCMSFSGLLPYLNAADSVDTVTERDRHLREDASQRLAAGLQEIPVDVLVRFRTTEADPLELAGLRVGDVVRLNHPAQAPLDVTAADVVFAHATPGSQGRRLAALVVAPSNQENR
jgi:flagellar motor switch protein FliM